MKKSTRILALLLCVVMVAALMPTFAMAADEYKLVDPKNTLNQPILTLSQDRYTVKVGSEISYTDTGYGYETTYMFPQGNGGTAYEFNIHRTQSGTGKETDLNRWWRWAKDGDVLNQRQSDSQAGYNTATPGVDGWTATVVYRNDGDANGRLMGDSQPVPKDSSRSQEYILMKPLLMPRPYCFIWTGGNRTRSANVTVKIDTTKDVGTSAILWSANGTDSKHFGNFLKTHEIETNRRVHYGDLGQNYMVIVEAKYVYYDLDGGNFNGDTRTLQYPCWTTGTAKTSQKHRVISDVPSKEGMVFDGWYCVELGKLVVAGSDLNNGITADMHLVAQWKNDVNDPDYFISFDGNGNTNTDVQMDNQKMEFDVADTLSANKYIQEYNVTYNANGGECTEKSAVAASEFLGWSTSASSGAVYGDREEVMNLTDVKDAVVPLWAQWQKGSVVLPTPNRDVMPEDDDSIVGYIFDGWYDGNTLVGMGGDTYTPGKNVELKAKWTPVKDVVFYVYHDSTGKTEAYNVKDYADVRTSGGEPYINKYKSTFDITSVVTEGYLYGGTFESDLTTVADFNGVKGNTDGSPKKIYPEIGKTYYVHEVSSQHLNPMTVSVWANAGSGNYDITHIYLMTAVDRTLYNQVGFNVAMGSNSGRDYVAANSTSKEIYDQVGITQSGKTTYKSYYDLSMADTTQNSKVACFEVTGFATETNVTVVPYWITLDGVKVTGPAQRVFQYMGPGAGNSHRMLKIVSDTWINPTLNLAPAPVSFAAPLMAAPRFMASQASPVVIETNNSVTVFDAGKEYTVEAVDNSIKGLIQPAGVDGKLFSGWFADEAFTVAADLENVSAGDSVYAKYVDGNYLQVKYLSVFTLLNKTISLTAAVDSKDYAETGFVIETKNGTDTVVVNSYASKFALQNAGQLFGAAKDAPLMNVDYKLNGLSRNDKVTITPYWVTADGTTVYGTARTLTYNGLVMKG